MLNQFINFSLISLCIVSTNTRAAPPPIGCDSEKPHLTYPQLPNIESSFKIVRRGITGQENLQITYNQQTHQPEIKVKYPKGSYDPGTMKKNNSPLGGAVFRSPLSTGETDCIFLSYSVQFAENFNFGLGGKLPGLYGGRPISGGEKADGKNGFSIRIKWDENGQGSPYAYIPEKKSTYGETFGEKPLLFIPGKKHKITLQIKLNSPEKKDGLLMIWQDGTLKYKNTEIKYRESSDLKISGFLFSTFFGGHNPEYASPNETYAIFTEIFTSNYLILN